MSTNTFSVNSCYAVLSSCAEGDPLHALLKLVMVLVDEKQYSILDPQIMVEDFEKKYGFPLPYHPMQAVIQLGIEEKVFAYNSSLKIVYPILSAISSEEFMKIKDEKDRQYDEVLNSFGAYLQEKYNLFCSKENLSEKVHAFIQRYGLISKTDRSILLKVKNDYHFAEYLLHCNEKGDSSTLEYIDEYITGCAFAEVVAFSVPTEKYKNCRARVFLDTGFVFALLGIGSKDRSKNFRDLFDDMVRLGMQPFIFLHTYSEIAGIIDTARAWIGNDHYDPSMASETAYFFVTNNWSYQKATELLGDLKRILTEDFRITIDETPYPRIEDIRTKHEADIKQAIIDEYFHSNAKFPVKEKEYTINQDARSLFMVHHFDNGYIARGLPEVKNIFITTNKTLAKVGKALTAEIAHYSGAYIPIALTDLTWGTLIWANTPTKISAFNKANIISAAYAAFQPSEEILRKLNSTLLKCQLSGEISPEKCYFLKTNAIALRMLSQETQNDESRYSEQLPFEILRELKKEGFEEGISEKQKEVDRLVKEKETATVERLLEKQADILDKFEREKLAKKAVLDSQKQRKMHLEQHISSMDVAKRNADRKIKRRMNFTKLIAAIVSIIYICIAIKISKSVEYSWVVDVIGAVATVVIILIAFCCKYQVKPDKIATAIEESITTKLYSEYCFNPNDYNELVSEYRNAIEKVDELQFELEKLSDELEQIKKTF